MCAILPVANACATLGRGVQAEQGAVTDGAGISQTIDRLGSVEARLANIEAQQNGCTSSNCALRWPGSARPSNI